MGVGRIPETGVGVQGEQVYQGQRVGIPGGRYTKEEQLYQRAGILGVAWCSGWKVYRG